jgi:hypothetical protein
MLYKSAMAVLAAVGSAAIAFAPAAAAQPAAQAGHHAPAAVSAVPALKARTVTLPGGVAVSFGFTNLAQREVPPLNGSPTARQAFLDDTAFARITGPATGELTVGYEAACAVDVSPTLDLNAGVSVGGSVTGGAEAEPGIEPPVLPFVELGAGPAAQAGIGGNLIVGPGGGKAAVVDSGSVPAGKLMPFINDNVSFKADGCGGPLTVRPFVTIVVCAPAAHYHDTVYGDPFTL